MKKFPIKVLAMLILFVTFTASCSRYISPDGQNTGEVLDAEFFESVSIELAQSRETVPPSGSLTISDEYDLDMQVIWTKNGKVWHIYSDCPYCKSSSDLMSGYLIDAATEGKTRPCSYCEELYRASGKDNIETGDDIYDIP